MGLKFEIDRFGGSTEVRLVPGRSGIASMEYEAEAGAIPRRVRLG